MVFITKNLLAIVAAIVAVAADSANAVLVARSDSVTVCHNINFGAPCVFAPNSNGACHNVGSADNDAISSIRLGPGTNCVFYSDGNCSGRVLTVNKDIPDLRTVNFNDIISSFTCFQASTTTSASRA